VNRLITATFLGLTAVGVCIAEKDSQDEWVGPIKQAESKLRQKMRGENGPQEIYALLTEGTWGGLGSRRKRRRRYLMKPRIGSMD
jgi:hypothetical protein